MKKLNFATIAAADLAVVSFGLAVPATAAPSDTGAAQDTINELEAQGYHVIVHKVGSAPLSQCAVSATKPGHTYSRTDSGVPGGGHTTTVTAKTINVYLSC
ncbi:hypothetical protein FR943_18305 [Mycobacterium sp. TNTM28]|uniref:PASTA domain-containing protein n=2 Tax=[Mycobacterium] fortunisiensis TaxID=2600579 RepID=A0ABS6KQJ6_9MYCO|nr:hypothetical protein [[Mycobacterium] fortunisiensis]